MELNNLAYQPGMEDRLKEMFEQMEKWQLAVKDTVALTSPVILPMEYDPARLVRKPDQWQPEYTLKKYFNRN